MKLVETAQLAGDLEKGLGEVHWAMKGIYPWLRLRTSVGAVTSLAVSQILREQGYNVELVVSQPELFIDPEMQHVIPVVHENGVDTIIDSTYSQFLEYAGLYFGYVMFGGKNDYPEEKITSFEVGEAQKVVTRLSLLARYVMDHYEPVDEMPFPRIEFLGFTDEQIEATLAAIWNPDNFVEFTPSNDTLEASKKLAEFIVPEHIKLVA